MSKPSLDPAGFFSKIPLAPHQLIDPVTATDDVIVLCHHGVVRVQPHDWALDICGLVRAPLQLRLSDLTSRPKVKVLTVHQCAGSPLDPNSPKRRICNVEWGGVRLSDLLTECSVLDEAHYAWSFGMDYGAFAGVECGNYVKDLPLDRVSSDVLIAYELNGEPLRPENGYPARLVVPGFYGTNSVKWLSRIELAPRRADGPFTTRWYNDIVKDESGRPTGITKPVWQIAPESVIVAPASEAHVSRAQEFQVWGWAWADGGVSTVELSFDNGRTWAVASLDPSLGRGWQRFKHSWIPQAAGPITVCSRAKGRDGQVQPLSDARNAIHSVDVFVD